MGASTSSCNPLPPPALSLLSSSKIHPRSAAAPWTPVLVPSGVDNLHQHPCAPWTISTPRIHLGKKERDPLTTRTEFRMSVYTVRRVLRAVLSNSFCTRTHQHLLYLVDIIIRLIYVVARADA